MEKENEIIVSSKHKYTNLIALLDAVNKEHRANFVAIKKNSGDFMYLLRDLLSNGDSVKFCSLTEDGTYKYALNKTCIGLVYESLKVLLGGRSVSLNCNHVFDKYLCIKSFSYDANGFSLKLKGHIHKDINLDRMPALVSFLIEDVLFRQHRSECKSQLMCIEHNTDERVLNELRLAGLERAKNYLLELNDDICIDNSYLNYYTGIDFESFDFENTCPKENPCFISPDPQKPINCIYCKNGLKGVIVNIKGKCCYNEPTKEPKVLVSKAKLLETINKVCS